MRLYKFYTREEVATHNKHNDAWVIYNSAVYDISNFSHPGGSLSHYYGQDVTSVFDANETHRIIYRDSQYFVLNWMATIYKFFAINKPFILNRIGSLKCSQ